MQLLLLLVQLHATVSCLHNPNVTEAYLAP